MRIVFPTATEYQQAVDCPGQWFRVSVLKTGKARTDFLGLPRPITGNFAVVFHMDCPGSSYAVKCFTQPLDRRHERYSAIAKRLGGIKVSWKIDFEYFDKGITVNNGQWPILKMEWIEAVGILSYIETNLQNKRGLVNLAKQFKRVVTELEDVGIAHGDLQHGNILVAKCGTIRLVDYDSMFIPGLEGYGPSDEGHRNYQSPKRSRRDYGPGLDRFSAWVIYLALMAVAEEPDIWHRLHTDGDESLIFSEQDFLAPDDSSAVEMLLASRNPVLREIAAKFISVSTQDLASIPPLSNDMAAPAVPVVHPVSPASLPDWLTERTAFKSVKASAPALISAPIAPPKPPSVALVQTTLKLNPQQKGTDRKHVLQCRYSLAGLGIVFAMVASAGGMASPEHVIVASFFSAILLAILLIAYYSGPELQYLAEITPDLAIEKENLKRVTEAADLLRRSINKEETSLAHQMRPLEVVLTQLSADENASLGALRARVKLTQTKLQDRSRVLAEVDSREAAEISQLKDDQMSKASKVQQTEQDALNQALEDYRAQQLRKHLVRNAGLSGISSGVISALKAAGISSAGDFQGIQLGLPHAQSIDLTKAVFIVQGRRPFQVPNIGPARAKLLDEWRLSLKKKLATVELPAALQEKAIQDFKAEQAKFAADEQRWLSDLSKKKTEIIGRYSKLRESHQLAIRALERELQRLENDLPAEESDIKKTLANKARLIHRQVDALKAKQKLASAQYGKSGFQAQQTQLEVRIRNLEKEIKAHQPSFLSFLVQLLGGS